MLEEPTNFLSYLGYLNEHRNTPSRLASIGICDRFKIDLKVRRVGLLNKSSDRVNYVVNVLMNTGRYANQPNDFEWRVGKEAYSGRSLDFGENVRVGITGLDGKDYNAAVFHLPKTDIDPKEDPNKDNRLVEIASSVKIILLKASSGWRKLRLKTPNYEIVYPAD